MTILRAPFSNLLRSSVVIRRLPMSFCSKNDISFVIRVLQVVKSFITQFGDVAKNDLAGPSFANPTAGTFPGRLGLLAKRCF